MRAIVQRIGADRIGLIGRSDSGHWTPMDTDSDHGGHGGASSPMELLLIALGGCTAMDVLSILAKKQVKLDDLEIELDADRSEGHPKVFTAVRLVYRFYGEGLRESDLEQAVRLSQEQYCSVSAMLKKAAPVEYRVEMHPPRAARP